MANLTQARVEDLKIRERFDERLAERLLPVGHPKRSLVEDSPFREQVIKSIQRGVNRTWCEFVAGGCKKFPSHVFDRPAVRVKRQFSPRSEVEVHVRQFIALCFTEMDQTDKVLKRKVRVATRQAMRLLTEIIRRTNLARLLSH